MTRHESVSTRSEAQQLLDDGFVVLREVIPAALLETIRASCEKLAGLQRRIWARERNEDDPTGGLWETVRQPRLVTYERLVDSETVPALTFPYGESTLGVCLIVTSPTLISYCCR